MSIKTEDWPEGVLLHSVGRMAESGEDVGTWHAYIELGDEEWMNGRVVIGQKGAPTFGLPMGTVTHRPSPEVAELRAEVDRLKAVVDEINAERDQFRITVETELHELEATICMLPTFDPNSEGTCLDRMVAAVRGLDGELARLKGTEVLLQHYNDQLRAKVASLEEEVAELIEEIVSVQSFTYDNGVTSSQALGSVASYMKRLAELGRFRIVREFGRVVDGYWPSNDPEKKA